MDISGNIDLQTRRLRLISDIMEDYQYNIRQTIRLISIDMDGSSITGQNGQTRRVETPPLDNATNNATNNARRGFIYTQYIEPNINQTPIDQHQYQDEDEEGICNEQIHNCTQIVEYNESMSDLRCPITWDQFDASHSILKINRCGHMFGGNALITWFQNHRRCPVCRTLVIEQTPSPLSANRMRINRENINNSTYNNIFNNILYRAFSGETTPQRNTEYVENEIIFNDLTDFYASLINTQNYTTNE
jgi:hypothetical protein